jgi:hypothetical protein
MTDSNLIPFGKYKGQPIEALAQDRQYVEWLTAQPWFRERFASLYTVIINNFQEPSETPDHNALQVLFLDDAFCARFMAVLTGRDHNAWLKELVNSIKGRRQTFVAALKEADERCGDKPSSSAAESAQRFRADRLNRLLKSKAECEQAFVTFAKPIEWKIVFGKAFEKDGVDVQMTGSIRTTVGLPVVREQHLWGVIEYIGEARTEIKPSVSDDYPAVLRQMRGNGSTVLFTERYTGTGATEKQFVETFKISGIKVVFRHEVEAAQLPALTGTLALP